jgi:pantoate--beta-alanine ligase
VETIETVAGLRQRLAVSRTRGSVIGFVPTMGALHAGHGALIDRARAECGVVVVSLFVNPSQFDRRDDYEAYARTPAEDEEFCAARGADVLFAPTEKEMYRRPQATIVEVPEMAAHLCGRFRPGHFRGVATVVAKLFGIVQPDRAYFGRKDAQQLAIIARMAADLDMPVEIVPVATVREADGLALSSRNRRLSAEERRAAPVLFRALTAVKASIEAGRRDTAAALSAGLAIFEAEPLARPEYLEIADAASLQPAGRIEGPVLIAGAVWIGATRLIDNLSWPD